jgi:hypothetical protein
MQRYLIASGILFTFIAATWCGRWVIGLTIVVGGIDVPMWLSVFPMVVTATLAIWAFTLAATARTPRQGP